MEQNPPGEKRPSSSPLRGRTKPASAAFRTGAWAPQMQLCAFMLGFDRPAGRGRTKISRR